MRISPNNLLDFINMFGDGTDGTIRNLNHPEPAFGYDKETNKKTDKIEGYKYTINILDKGELDVKVLGQMREIKPFSCVQLINPQMGIVNSTVWVKADDIKPLKGNG